MHLIPNNGSPASDGRRPRFTERMERRLDGLCARQDQMEADLYRLPRPRFERACAEMRRIWHMRDLMRLRLFAARCGRLSRDSRVGRKIRAEWPRLMRASWRLERILNGAGDAEELAAEA